MNSGAKQTNTKSYEFHPLLTAVPLELLSPNIDTTALSINSHRTMPTKGREDGIATSARDLGHEGIVRAGIKVGYCLTDFPAPQSGFTMFAPGSHLYCRRRCPFLGAKSIQRGRWICVSWRRLFV